MTMTVRASFKVLNNLTIDSSVAKLICAFATLPTVKVCEFFFLIAINLSLSVAS